MEYRVHGILQVRILEWVAIPFSRGSSKARYLNWVSHTAVRFFIVWATREPKWGKDEINFKREYYSLHSLDIRTCIMLFFFFIHMRASLVAKLVKNLPAMQETPVWFLGREDPLEKDRLLTPVFLGFPDDSAGKESACNVGNLGVIPGLGRPLEKGKATHSSILAWRIPWTVYSMGL